MRKKGPRFFKDSGKSLWYTYVVYGRPWVIIIDMWSDFFMNRVLNQQVVHLISMSDDPLDQLLLSNAF